MTPTDPALWF